MAFGVETMIMESPTKVAAQTGSASDEALLAQYARTGAPEVLSQLIERHSAMVYATCLRVLGDRAAAEDAAQAAFLVFVQKAKTLPPETLLATWLYYAAHNSAREVRRANARRLRREKEAAEMATQSSSSGLWKEISGEVDDALNALPAAQRDAVVLRYLYGYTTQETAEKLRCPEETLHTRLTRGMQRLRERLGRRGAALSAVALTALLSERAANAAQATPAGLSKTITSACLGKSTASVTASATAKSLALAMSLAKIKTAVLAAIVALAIVIPLGVSAYRALGDTPAAMPPAPSTASPKATAPANGPFSAWKNGPSNDPNYFPIAVWMQDVKWAREYRAAGFNLYLGLQGSLGEAKLEALRVAGVRVVCQQDAASLLYRDNNTIAGWLNQEPRSATDLKPRADRYKQIAEADTTRPVWLFCGSEKEYASYHKACDVAVVDIWSSIYDKSDGKPAPLNEWLREGNMMWNLDEITVDPQTVETLHRFPLETEIWMGVCAGARGYILWVHKPDAQVGDDSLMHNAPLLAEITRINQRVAGLAPVINAPQEPDGVRATTDSTDAQFVFAMRRFNGSTYVFAVERRGYAGRVTFNVRDIAKHARAEALNEDREISVENGRFEDDFQPWAVHLYRIH